MAITAAVCGQTIWRVQPPGTPSVLRGREPACFRRNFHHFGGEMKDHRLIDERSLAFGQLIAAKLRADPTLVQLARDNLER